VRTSFFSAASDPTAAMTDFTRSSLSLKAYGLISDGIVERFDPQHGSDSRDERGCLYRFGQVLVPAGIESGDDVRWISFGGNHHHGDEGQARVRLEAPADLHPVESGHNDIEQNQVRGILDCDAESFLSRRRRRDLKTLSAQAGLKNVNARGVVIHNEDQWGAAHPRLPSGLTARVGEPLLILLLRRIDGRRRGSKDRRTPPRTRVQIDGT